MTAAHDQLEQAANDQDANLVLVHVALALLEQCCDLVKLLNDEQLRLESRQSPGSTVGKHLRHLKDHYSLLIEAVRKDHSKECIDLSYDQRSRNVPMESSTASAIHQLQRVSADIRELAPQCGMRKKIALQATTPTVVSVESTFGRELWFASLHATHHLALVRLIVASEFPDITIPPDFGVAPSTIVHRQQSGKL